MIIKFKQSQKSNKPTLKMIRSKENGDFIIVPTENTKKDLKVNHKEVLNMKGLTFKEVIANIKEGEVWESNTSYIKKEKDSIDIWNNKPSKTVKSILDNTLFTLQRKQYTFEEAFKSFEDGKEIESEYGTKYKFDKTSFEVSMIETQNGDAKYIYSFEDVLFRCDEIKGKWYIND